MPSVSVIIPVYNTKEYLGRCLDSILHQSMMDIEIIVINDGSTDQSSEILMDYETRYSQICVITQENQGISATRNLGIQVASAPYVVFIDSDDYIDTHMIETLYTTCEKEQLDIVVCGFYECRGSEQKEIKMPTFTKCKIEEQPSLLFDINSSPWNKMFRRSFLIEHQLQFPLGKKYEDAQFLLCALISASAIGVVHKPFVYYQIHEGSETTSMNERVFDIFDILTSIHAWADKSGKGQKLYEYIEYFAINRLSVYHLQQMYQKDKQVAKSFIDHGYAYLDQYYPNWRKNKPYRSANSLMKQCLKNHKWICKCYVMLKWGKNT